MVDHWVKNKPDEFRRDELGHGRDHLTNEFMARRTTNSAKDVTIRDRKRIRSRSKSTLSIVKQIDETLRQN